MKPALRAHVGVHRQRLGSRVSYVMQDRIAGRHHRLGEEAWTLVRRMDGTRSLDEIWRDAAAELGEALPSQGETMRLLSQLLRADLVHCDDKRLAEALAERRDRERRRRWVTRAIAPLSIKLPLFDPDRFVTRTLPWVMPLLGRGGFVAWLLLVALGAALAVMHAPELASNVSDRLLTLENVLALWLVYPVVKAVHELGHAWMIKRWGGEVHELGVMLLVFFPIPYVDASASMAFAQRHQRVLVAAIGVMVELAIASLAMVVWVLAEPGAARSLAFNVLLIAGLSSLLFNGNPLMRYDAYYVLAEAVGQPTLDRNGARRFTELAVAALGGDPASSAFADWSRGERATMLGYAVTAYLYRTVVMLAIAVLLVRTVPLFGVLLAAMVVLTSVLLPLYRLGQAWRHASRGVRRPWSQRLRPWLALAGLAAALFAVPWPYATTVQGVVMPAEEAAVRAGTEGRIVAEQAERGAWVQPGAPLLRLTHEEARTAEALALARRDEIRAQIAATVRTPAQQSVLAAELDYAERQLEQVRQRLQRLQVVAPTAGRWVPLHPPPLVERYVGRGELIGHVVDPARVRLVAVVDEEDVLPVRDRTRGVTVRGAGGDPREHTSRVLRLQPGATTLLPHIALTVDGGGRIARNPEVTDRVQAIRQFFWVDLATDDLPVTCLDCRVDVRFEHPPEPVGWRWGRWLRRQFLGLLEH